MNKLYKFDKFERWLSKNYPELLCEYERGADRGNIDIVALDFGFYHLYYKGRLLGTLIS